MQELQEMYNEIQSLKNAVNYYIEKLEYIEALTKDPETAKSIRLFLIDQGVWN